MEEKSYRKYHNQRFLWSGTWKKKKACVCGIFCALYQEALASTEGMEQEIQHQLLSRRQSYALCTHKHNDLENPR